MSEHERRGLLVTFEGGEGSGKSTQAARLAEALTRDGAEVVRIREPGDTPVGETVRELLLDVSRGPTVHRAELLLYLSARAELTGAVIEPALARGAIVLCDRFVDASVAYQGAGRALGVDVVRELNAFATRGRSPDLTFLLDVTPEVGLARAAGRGRPDRIERQPLAFHTAVREAYLAIARAEPDRVRVIDATRPAPELHREVLAATRAVLDRS